MYIFFQAHADLYVNYVMPLLCSCIQLLKLLLFLFFFPTKNSVCHPTFDLAPEVINASGEVNKESRLIAEE